MRIKVCGIGSYDDAKLALEYGADALGFNFYRRSPRYISPSGAGEIIRSLPPLTVSVGLFVNMENPAEVESMAREARVSVLQLHGDESPEYCRALLAWPVIKALRIDGSPETESLRDYPVQAFLLDSRDDTLFGGTGKTFRWSLASSVKQFKPVILAGGLNAGNIREAIQAVRPYGVDVCTGVESSPGKKDASKLKAFIDEVRNVCRDHES